MKTKISVVIPVFNEEKLLPRCLQALRNQTYPRDHYEIIVADNGSTDKTARIAKKLGTIVHSYTDIKKCGAIRQFGATKATAPIIAFTDADCMVPYDWLTAIDKLMKNPNLLCVGGKVLPDKSNFTVFCIYTFYDIFYRLNQCFHKTLLWGSNLAVRKAALEKIGGFNTSLATSDDWDLPIRLQKKFGKKTVLYAKRLQVYTSTRKQSNIKAFTRYAWDGIRNYINVVLLDNTRSSGLEDVR